MSSVKSFLIKKFLAKGRNLISVDNHYQVVAKLLKGRSVTGIIDVGASHGRVSKRFLRYFPDATAYAFEPNPCYKDILTSEAQKNAQLAPQFYALSDHQGSADLVITASPGATSLFQPNSWFQERYPEDSKVVEKVSVDLTTIDAWVEERGDLNIDMIKLDIQGGELLALKGAEKTLKNKVLLVYTEVLFNPLYEGGAIFSDLDNYLRSCGFALYDLYKPKYDAQGMLMWGNAIYLHQEKMGYSN